MKFFRQDASGSEPVRIWLKSLPEEERKAIGMDIMAAQFGWPLGLPLVDHIDGDVWEVRTKLTTRIARVLFVVDGTAMVLLHGFIKKGNKTATGPEPRQGSIETTERQAMSNGHIGSSFDEFLREEGIFEEVEAGAIKKVVACMIEQAMAESHITKTEMARRMETSRTQLDRLLDPTYPSVTLATIAKAATALGKRMSISFEDFLPIKKDVITS